MILFYVQSEFVDPQGLLHDNMWDKREYDYRVRDILVVGVTHF